jgi:RNA methyltransferase, TrmH family
VITSTSNAQVKYVRSLLGQGRARRAENAFVVEGVRLVEEAAASGWACRLVLYSAGLGERGAALLPVFQAAGAQVEEVAPHVMEAASATQTPQGILAVLQIQEKPLPQPLTAALILDQVRDPGNLGTILRTAAAAGVQPVFLAPGSADPYAPKVVRAAMGAHFRLALKTIGWDEISRLCQQNHLQILLADAAGEQVYTSVDLRSPFALLIGGEAHGASPLAASLAHLRVRIPLAGQMESLNAAAAAAVLLFEAARQRASS